MKKIWMSVLFLLLAVGCTTQVDQPEPTPTAESEFIEPCSIEADCSDEEEIVADMSEYEGVGEEHVFVSKEYPDLLEMIENKETAIVYIGRESCPFCYELVPVLNEVALENEVTVYYVNTRTNHSTSDEGKAQLEEIKIYLNDFLTEDDEGNKAMYVPNVLFMKEGEVFANHVSTVDGHDANESKMNDEQTAQLKDILTQHVVGLYE